MDSTMRQTYLPDCDCKTRRVIIVSGIVRCGDCYKRYGKAGSYSFSDNYLKDLIDNADMEDEFYQLELRLEAK